jgi:hypothetical protein
MRLDELGIEMVLDELEIEISQESAPRDMCTNQRPGTCARTSAQGHVHSSLCTFAQRTVTLKFQFVIEISVKAL